MSAGEPPFLPLELCLLIPPFEDWKSEALRHGLELAIDPAKDYAPVIWRYLHWLLTSDKVNPCLNDPLARTSVRLAADIMRQMADTGSHDPKTFDKASAIIANALEAIKQREAGNISSTYLAVEMASHCVNTISQPACAMDAVAAAGKTAHPDYLATALLDIVEAI